MATPNINVLLQSVISVTNNLLSPAPQIINLDFQNPTLPSAGVGGTTLLFEPYFQAAISGTAVLIPGRIYCLAVQNLSPTANLIISYTPFGGVSTSITVGPNGVLIIFDPSEAGTSIGAVTLQGVGGTVPAVVLAAV